MLDLMSLVDGALAVFRSASDTLLSADLVVERVY